MRSLLTVGLTLVVAISSSAEQVETGAIVSRVADVADGSLPGVTVTATAGDIRRQAVSLGQGEFELRDVPAGVYTVTAALPGFLTGTQAVRMRSTEQHTLEFVLPIGCLAIVDRIHFPFDTMLGMAAAVAHLRILEMDEPQHLVTPRSCAHVRPYVAEVLGLPRPVQGDAKKFHFNASASSPPLALGDELIMFFWRDDVTGDYHEYGDAYRMPLRNGRLEWHRTDVAEIANGQTAEEVLNTIRLVLSRQPPPRS